MKWNWGTKLAIAMASFMIMIIIFATLMMRESVDLVEKDYYPKGQAFQDLIQKKSNAEPFVQQIQLEAKDGVLQIHFPEFFTPSGLKGSVFFYNRVKDSGDMTYELSATTDGAFTVPLDGLSGRYIVKIDWEYEGVPYFVEKSLDIN
jgi:hypothetical protein